MAASMGMDVPQERPGSNPVSGALAGMAGNMGLNVPGQGTGNTGMGAGAMSGHTPGMETMDHARTVQGHRDERRRLMEQSGGGPAGRF